MRLNTSIIIGSVMAVVATVLVFVKIMPKKNAGECSEFGEFLYNYFNFEKFYLETILKFLFVLSTLACIFIGFWMLYAKNYWGWYGNNYIVQGILLMIGGPIVVRVVYELLMMTIVAVRNITEINSKISMRPDEKTKPATKTKKKDDNDMLDTLLSSGAITKEEYEKMKTKMTK